MALRESAFHLIAKGRAIISWGLWSKLKLIPDKENILEAYKDYIFLSNMLNEGDDALENIAKQNNIEMLLGFSLENLEV